MSKIILFLCISTFICTAVAQDIGELIIEYEQECYADSSWGLVFPKQPPYILIYKQPYYAWVHRRPDWDGFREFIKRRKSYD